MTQKSTAASHRVRAMPRAGREAAVRWRRRAGPGSGGVVGQEPGHVAHLAAGTRAVLAVEVYGGIGHAQPPGVVIDLVADQVDHFDPAVTDRPAERPAGHRADVL